MRKLGSVQQGVYDMLKRQGRWHPNAGWLWDTPSNTRRLMDSLVRAGYARWFDDHGQRVVLPVDPKAAVKSAVVLSDGRVVDGGDVPTMLGLQWGILLKLSKALAKQGHGEGSAAQKAIADANMLGLEVAERWEEL